MKKSIVTLAFLIALMPYEIGINESWKNIFITASGLLIILLVLTPRKEKPVYEGKKDSVSFVESNPANKEKEQSNTHEETLS